MAELEVAEDVTEEIAEPGHVLVLGDKSFVCADNLPMTWIIRHMDKDWVSYVNVFLTKVVSEDDLNDMWEAFEATDEEEALEAVNALVRSYSERPTARPARSPRGSKNAKRK